jgi:alpha-beta hydrolase superfamily lysophospholipase
MRSCGFAEKGRVMSVLQKAVTSSDGTTIAYEQAGHGPAVILVASSLADRSDIKRLAALLASRFTVINYDRRGRGLSSDTPPYDVQREVEDMGALVDEAGGSAFVFGSSSGAVLPLRQLRAVSTSESSPCMNHRSESTATVHYRRMTSARTLRG